MNKLTILLFSILISFSSYGGWVEIDKTMHEILKAPGAEIISVVPSGNKFGNMIYIIKINSVPTISNPMSQGKNSLPLFKCVDIPNGSVLTCWWLL